jgi:hypothetical protein
MVKNQSPSQLSSSPGSVCRFVASRNVIQPRNPKSGGPHRLNAGPGGQAYPPRAHRPVQQMNEKVSS